MLICDDSCRFSRENFPKILKVVESINAIAAKYHATPGQIALSWLLAQGPDIVPIPGTRSAKVRFSLQRPVADMTCLLSLAA